MAFDSLTIALSLVISLFSFLVFILFTKRSELNFIQKELGPVLVEAKKALMQNFLSLGVTPSKSKFISILSGIAKKHNIQLLSYVPLHEMIDDLVYSVISNELVDSNKKEMLVNQLMQLKNEPINSEDYAYLLVEIEKADSLKHKMMYTNFISALVVSSLITVGLALPFIQFRAYWSQEVVYIVSLVLMGVIGFSVLTALTSIWLVCSSIFVGKNESPVQQQKNLVAINQQAIDYESLSLQKKKPINSLNSKLVDHMKSNSTNSLLAESSQKTSVNALNLQSHKQQTAMSTLVDQEEDNF